MLRGYALVPWVIFLLTLHEHEHPHAERDGCSTYWRDIMMDSIIVVDDIVGDSLLL